MPSPRVKAQCLTHWEAFSGVLSNTTLGFEAPLRPLRVCCGYTELFFFFIHLQDLLLSHCRKMYDDILQG